METPCHYCTDRKPACHDTCAKFAEYHDKHMLRKKAEYKEALINGYTKKSVLRSRDFARKLKIR